MPITIKIIIGEEDTQNTLAERLLQAETRLSTVETKIMNFQDDETRLEADIQANSDATVKVQATLADNQTQIQTLQDALAAQKSQGVDTTAMEAALAKLESNTQVLAQLPPVPAATVAAATGTSEGAVVTP